MPPKRRADFDPSQYQMSIGDHLEELRRRILLGILGLAPCAVVSLIFGQRILYILCRPLIDALQKNGISPQLYTHEAPDAFMVYVKVCFIAAAALAGPWMIYQIWQFIAAGLYPRERRYVTKYIPLSVALLFCGMLFVYFIVLPWSLEFFIKFTADIPLPMSTHAAVAPPQSHPSFVQSLEGDPPAPGEFQIWFDTTQDRLKFFSHGRVRVIPFGPANLINTQFTLPDYLDLVLRLLLTFGLAFQLPLVVMALARLGIVELATLKKLRRYVYFGLSVLAASLAPGDVVTATLALLAPLILLYELGLFLARGPSPKAPDVYPGL
jgi:sec-independent protein translocase protein TatC